MLLALLSRFGVSGPSWERGRTERPLVKLSGGVLRASPCFLEHPSSVYDKLKHLYGEMAMLFLDHEMSEVKAR